MLSADAGALTRNLDDCDYGEEGMEEEIHNTSAKFQSCIDAHSAIVLPL